MSANLGPWEDDGLLDEAVFARWLPQNNTPSHRRFYAQLDNICHRCDEPWHRCDCADPWDEREDDVESGHPLTHQRGDDGEYDV